MYDVSDVTYRAHLETHLELLTRLWCAKNRVTCMEGESALRLHNYGMMTAWFGLCESWWGCSRTLSGSSHSSFVRPRRSAPKT